MLFTALCRHLPAIHGQWYTERFLQKIFSFNSEWKLLILKSKWSKNMNYWIMGFCHSPVHFSALSLTCPFLCMLHSSCIWPMHGYRQENDKRQFFLVFPEMVRYIWAVDVAADTMGAHRYRVITDKQHTRINKDRWYPKHSRILFWLNTWVDYLNFPAERLWSQRLSVKSFILVIASNLEQ